MLRCNDAPGRVQPRGSRICPYLPQPWPECRPTARSSITLTTNRPLELAHAHLDSDLPAIVLLATAAAEADAQTLCTRATMNDATAGEILEESFRYGGTDRFLCTYLPSMLDGR